MFGRGYAIATQCVDRWWQILFASALGTGHRANLFANTHYLSVMNAFSVASKKVDIG